MKTQKTIFLWVVLLFLNAKVAFFLPKKIQPTCSILPYQISLNSASLEELQLIPGLGKKRASLIWNQRQKKGSFKTLEELTEIKGIGFSFVKKIAPFLKI